MSEKAIEQAIYDAREFWFAAGAFKREPTKENEQIMNARRGSLQSALKNLE